MKVLVALVTILLSVLVSGFITGQHPAPGACLCVTGTNVNAHVAAGLDSTVIGAVSKPLCWMFHGGNINKDGYTWYELEPFKGSFFWIAATHLSISTASHCSPPSPAVDTHPCTDATAKDYACKLLHLADEGNIILAKEHPSHQTDNAYAYNNIQDTCVGYPPSRSTYSCKNGTSTAPGGHLCLNARVLLYIYAVYHDLGRIIVNEVAGACHSYHSFHYFGRAVDLHNPDKHQSDTMVSICNSMAGQGKNKGSHVHCQFNETNARYCNDTQAIEYACKLLYLADTGAIILAKKHPSTRTDNAYAYNNIRDACFGIVSSRSNYTCDRGTHYAPGGFVCLKAKLLQYIYAVYQNLGRIRVNEVAGACHSNHSSHYFGRAVDLHNPDKHKSDTMVSICNTMGGLGINETNHIHCQFKETTLI